MRRGAAAAAGAATPNYEHRPQYKALAKKFASMNKHWTKSQVETDDLGILQQQLQQASQQLEQLRLSELDLDVAAAPARGGDGKGAAANAKERATSASTSRPTELPGKAAAEPKTSIQMYIDAVSEQCGGTLKPLMCASPFHHCTLIVTFCACMPNLCVPAPPMRPATSNWSLTIGRLRAIKRCILPKSTRPKSRWSSRFCLP